MKQTGTWIGGLLLFAAGLGCGWAVRTLVAAPQAESSKSADEEEDPAPVIAPGELRVQVTTLAAISGDLPITLVAPGIVRAAPTAEMTLSSRAGGRVLECPVAKGQVVKRGDLLLRLDAAPAQTALSQARAMLASSANQLAEFERSGSARQKLELETAVHRSISQVALLEASVNRLEPLRSDGLVSQKALAEAVQALESARADRELSERAQAAYVASGETLQSATLTAARDASELSVREAEKALAEAELRAPSDGRITELFVHAGETLVPGTTLAKLLAPSGREIVFAVPAGSIEDLKLGAHASWLDSKDETRTGTIVRIDGEVETVGGTLEVVVKPDDESARLLPGARLLGEIELRRLSGVILVPENAVLRAADLQVVVLAREGKAVVVPIQLLGRHAGLAAIAGPVREHDSVIVDGGYNLPDGAGVIEREKR